MQSRKRAVLGLTLVTPAMAAGQALATPSLAPITDAAAQGSGVAEARLKAEMLAISPGDKLDIAGERVQLLRLSAQDKNTHRITATGPQPSALCHGHAGPVARDKKTLHTYTAPPAPKPPPPPPPSGCTIWTLG